MAELADLHRTTVGNVETGRGGKGGPSLDTMERIAAALGTSTSALIAEAERRSD